LAVIIGSAFAQELPRLINYQGKLTDPTGVAIDGTANIVFRIYNAGTGGSLLWTETHSLTPVNNGLFDVILGETTPMTIDFNEQYWIELTVDGETLAPREQLSAVPYAHRSAYADTAIIIGSGAVQTTARLDGDGTASDPLDIAQQGASSGQVLKWSGTAWAPATDNVNDADYVIGNEDVTGLSFNTLDGVLTLTQDVGGTITEDLDGRYALSSGTVTGSGTQNYVSKFTSTGSVIGNSSIFDDGTNVGIGTTSPSEKLHVIGNIQSSNGALIGNQFISK